MEFERFATTLVETFGVQYDEDEGFVICPECGEPLYECDWPMNEIGSLVDKYMVYACPICGEVLTIEQL